MCASTLHARSEGRASSARWPECPPAAHANWMSIAGETVATLGHMAMSPCASVRCTTSLALVAQTMRPMGSPIFCAISPPHALPKAPVGTTKSTGPSSAGRSCRKAQK